MLCLTCKSTLLSGLLETRREAQSWTVTIQFHLPASGNPWDSSGEHWENTGTKTQQISVRPWTPLMNSLENMNSSLACWVPLAWSPIHMPLNTAFASVSLALYFPFLSFHVFSPHTHFYLNLTSQRSLYLPLSQILVNHVIGSSSESALNQYSSRVFLELPFLTCYKTKAPITQSH